MTARFCSQCGSQLPAGYAFCTSCGAAQSAGAQAPRQQAYQPHQQAYQQPHQAVPQTGHGYPRATTAKASGLIWGVFTLAAAFILAMLLFVLPSKEDFSLLGPGEGPDSSAAAYTEPESMPDDAGPASAVEYGAPPASLLERINADAVEEHYYGSYSGTVSFRSENLEIMTELTGDSTYVDIISKYNGKTYDCTAELGESLRAFSPEIYSENDDGSFYSAYYSPENGIDVMEDGDYDEEMRCRFYMADKAYFLTDGSLYLIMVATVEFDDGRFLANELRFELTPVP